MLSKGSSRQKMAKAIVCLLSDNIPEFFGNVKPVLKFWDEVEDFPFVSVTAASEQREYLPGSFEWGFIPVNIRIYVKSESSLDDLEELMVKVEILLRDNIELVYNTSGCKTTDIRISSIDTDGGLLAPHGVGEIVAVVQYQVN